MPRFPLCQPLLCRFAARLALWTLLLAAVGIGMGCDRGGDAPQATAHAEDDQSSDAPAPSPQSDSGDSQAAAGGEAIDPQARPLLKQIDAAYSQLKQLSLAGEMRVEVKQEAAPAAEGEDQPSPDIDQRQKFTASFQAPNRFRHEMPEEVILGSTGEQAFFYSPQANQYMTFPVEGDERDMAGYPPMLLPMLQSQNPSLLLALSGAPVEELFGRGARIRTADAQTIDGRKHPVLTLDLGERGQMQLVVDPKSHLLRRVVADLGAVMRSQGMDAQSATMTIDYTTVEPGATLDESQFAWTPPEGARDAQEAMRETQSRSPEQSLAMVGKPAPDFTLKSLDGEEVAMGDLKDQVVVLDFWATWCGPCVRSLPHLAELAKEASPKNVKVFAVNLQESPEEVKKFLEEQELELATLLDQEGALAEQYGIMSIPQMVIIGKDGLVRKGFIGMGPDTYDEVRSEIEAAIAGEPIAEPAVTEEEPVLTEEEPAAEDAAMDGVETPAGDENSDALPPLEAAEDAPQDPPAASSEAEESP